MRGPRAEPSKRDRRELDRCGARVMAALAGVPGRPARPGRVPADSEAIGAGGLIQVQWLRFPPMPDVVPSLMLVWSSLSCPDCGAPRLGRVARGGKGFPSTQSCAGWKGALHGVYVRRRMLGAAGAGLASAVPVLWAAEVRRGPARGRRRSR